MSLFFPYLSPPDPEVLRYAETTLTQSGCVARRRGENRLEVWEANLSEHYLLTFDTNPQRISDIMQLDGV